MTDIEILVGVGLFMIAMAHLVASLLAARRDVVLLDAGLRKRPSFATPGSLRRYTPAASGSLAPLWPGGSFGRPGTSM